MEALMLLLIVILVIGFAGIIGNQYSGLRRMEELQRSLDQLNQKLREWKR
ncbi:hypothetical protein [Gorillibacterium sp. sgz5001074]